MMDKENQTNQDRILKIVPLFPLLEEVQNDNFKLMNVTQITMMVRGIWNHGDYGFKEAVQRNLDILWKEIQCRNGWKDRMAEIWPESKIETTRIKRRDVGKIISIDTVRSKKKL